MSDRVVIKCPSCESKLGIKKSMLGTQVKCPTCGTYLSARAADKSGSGDASAGSSRRRQKKQSAGTSPSGRSAGSASRKSSSSKSKAKSAASRSAADQNPSKQRATQKKKKRASRPAPVEPDYPEDDWNSSDDGYDDYDDYGSDYAESDADLYGDDGGGWLDDAGANDWTAPASAAISTTPGKQRKKKSSDDDGGAKKKKKKKKKKRRSDGPVSVFTWVGAGLIAGLISVVLTIAVGFTGVEALLIVSAIFCGGLIGGSIRATAGDTDGWGPGLVAVFILLPALFVGRLGAFYLNPDLLGWMDDDYESSMPEVSEASIDRQTSEDGMIAAIVEDEVYYDDAWQSENGVNLDSNFYTEIDWESVDAEEVPYRDKYTEAVWAEGTRRWEAIPAEDRNTKMERQRQEMRHQAGLLTESEIDQLVAEATSDTAMQGRVAENLQYEEDFLEEAEIGRQEIWDYNSEHEAHENPETRYHPALWAGAVRRWEEMDESEKTQMRAEAEMEIRFVVNPEDVVEVFRIFVVVGVTIFSLISPLPLYCLGCTVSAVILAFTAGSGLATD